MSSAVTPMDWKLEARRRLQRALPLRARGQAPGVDPERRDFGSYGSFADPDGNGWLVQEVRRGNPDR